jgi:cell cycle checkpoint protein
LTGPAGTGKTATVRVLARELGFEILEWRNGVDDRFGDLGASISPLNSSHSLSNDSTVDFEGEALINKFRAFLTRASACTSVLQARPVASGMSSQAPSTHRVILLEDLPNILHGPTQTSFHTALQSLIEASVPVVVIVSDAGLRGEDVEGGTGWRGKEAVDVRTVLGPLVGSPYVTQIAFVVSPTAVAAPYPFFFLARVTASTLLRLLSSSGRCKPF